LPPLTSQGLSLFLLETRLFLEKVQEQSVRRARSNHPRSLPISSNARAHQAAEHFGGLWCSNSSSSSKEEAAMR
jgi:hypothetical protein